MPSREEIVDWLREAGRVEVALARMSGAGKGAEDFAAPWEKRAAQVEAMRCETCKRSHYCQHAYSGGGCFAHEQKPAG